MNVLQKAVQLSGIILHDVITSTTIQEVGKYNNLCQLLPVSSLLAHF